MSKGAKRRQKTYPILQENNLPMKRILVKERMKISMLIIWSKWESQSLNRPKATQKQAMKNLHKRRLENLRTCTQRCQDLKVSSKVKVKASTHLKRSNSSNILRSLRKISRLKNNMMKNFWSESLKVDWLVRHLHPCNSKYCTKQRSNMGSKSNSWKIRNASSSLTIAIWFVF